MKTLFTFLCLLVFCSHSFSQKEWLAVVETERKFALYAAEHNTRDAFLKFMDTSAVVFNNGEIQKAKAIWEAKQPNKAKLIWDPSFAVVSTGGDLAITSGPWQFKPEGKDSVVATGEFTTVWMKRDTSYRWIVDMGIEHNKKINKYQSVTGIELSHYEHSSYPGLRYMLMAEQNFINSYTAKGKDAYRDVLDDNVYFLMNGFAPFNGYYASENALTNMSGTMKFQSVGSGCSKEGDLGYVYGYVTDGDKKGNYLRVWRRLGRKWQILLQTLTI